MVQTRFVKESLEKIHSGTNFEIVGLSTAGDVILNQPLSAFSDKGVFTKELDVSLLRNETHFAVHSLKDLTTILPEGLALGAVLERVAVEDVLVVNPRHAGCTLDTLPPGSVIGTSSLRRTAMLRRMYPHFSVADIRGNLNTRLKKLDEGHYDAIVLAQAGVLRLGWQHRIAQVLDCSRFHYAVGQAALGVVCRADDAETLQLLAPLNHWPTRLACVAERGLLRALEGGCKVPIATSSHLAPDHTLTLRGVVISTDGSQYVEDVVSATVENEADARALGYRLAELLAAAGADRILAEIKGAATSQSDSSVNNKKNKK
eukprot:TRINITY_DN6592_c0_g1_i2.p1 TRINITY_DN6592_c0_g1~~TRINITY_DN6592_c0_g1_i2.p1  ORF type:complete len:317 (-),score=48.26 TRINITY_DN6592_c0_g1_i2:108-1058(-)